MDDGSGIGAIFILGLFIGAIVCYFITSYEFEKQAISRGYALYCPTNGDFAWNGECE
jgi:hypothetical protein